MNFLKRSKTKPKCLLVFSLKCLKSSNNPLINAMQELDPKAKSKALHIKLPKTTFNPRFHAKNSETLYHPKISLDLYRWQEEREGDIKDFFLHESPISLHEDLHLGHFFNKTIKDIILRMKIMKGFRVHSTLGFNCHGNSIENAALRKYTSESERVQLNVNDIRDLCKKYINENYEEYMKKIKRWGLMINPDKIYLTSNPLYEARVLEVFQILYEKSTLFQQWRPLFWSTINRKPVFEDEMKQEYVAKKGHFIKFQVEDFGPDDYLRINCPKLSFVVFSPEPWTLTAVQAVSLNPYFTYCVFQKEGEFILMHEQAFVRNKSYFKENKYEFVMKCYGKALNGIKLKDPISNRIMNISLSKEIKGSVGSGINPIVPAHYPEDFEYSQEDKLSRQGFIDEEGNIFGFENKTFNGKNVILDDANVAILTSLAQENKLLDSLQETANVSFLYHKETKEQIIVRSIPLWFCKINEEDKMEFLEEIKNLKIFDFSEDDSFYPSFIQILEELGSEWCISTQGNWGIPFPLFYHKGTTKAFLKSDILVHIIRNIRKHGSDIWWKWPIEDLLPKKYHNMINKLEKSKEIFDIWFEVGCSQYAVLENHLSNQTFNEINDANQKEIVTTSNNKSQSLEKIPNIDLIVEGKDQCECWLMGLSLINLLRTNISSIKQIKHHSLLLDPALENSSKLDKLNKYSNIKMSLEDIVEGTMKSNGERQYGLGVDVLRWFVASRDDLSKPELIKISPQDIDQMNSEINLIRKCFRELFMHLNQEFPNQFYIDMNNLSFMHDFLYTNLIFFLFNVTKAYENYDCSKVYRLILDFVKTYVWDIYLQGTKAFLISNPLEKESFTIVYMYSKICENLLLVLAPILCHNAQNIYEFVENNREKNIFHCPWPSISEKQIKNLGKKLVDYQILFDLRGQIIEFFEKDCQRVQKDLEKLKKSTELVFVCEQESPEMKKLGLIGKDDNFFFGFERITFETKYQNDRRDEIEMASFTCKIVLNNAKLQEFKVKAYKLQDHLCYRCWRMRSKNMNALCENCVSYLKKHQLKIEEIV